MRFFLLIIEVVALAFWTSGSAGEIRSEGFVTRSSQGNYYLLQTQFGGPAVYALTDPLSRLMPDVGKRVVLHGKLEQDLIDGLPHLVVRASFPSSWSYPAGGLRSTRDTDADTWPDAVDPDDDGDGMSDDYEYGNGLDPIRDDAGEDLDQDGMVNLDESVAGTAANDRNSVFRFSEKPMQTAPGSLSLTWRSVPGKRYAVWSSSRVEGPYRPMTQEVNAKDGAEVTSLNLTNVPLPGYYRVEVIQQK